MWYLIKYSDHETLSARRNKAEMYQLQIQTSTILVNYIAYILKLCQRCEIHEWIMQSSDEWMNECIDEWIN